MALLAAIRLIIPFMATRRITSLMPRNDRPPLLIRRMAGSTRFNIFAVDGMRQLKMPIHTLELHPLTDATVAFITIFLQFILVT